VRQQLHVVADAFTANARELIEEAGGTAELTERAERADRDDEAAADDESGDQKTNDATDDDE
jgi:large subunit ribosomal protein L15